MKFSIISLFSLAFTLQSYSQVLLPYTSDFKAPWEEKDFVNEGYSSGTWITTSNTEVTTNNDVQSTIKSDINCSITPTPSRSFNADEPKITPTFSN